MLFGTLSPENRLDGGLRELDCPASSFAKIADLPGTLISQALRGHTPFTNERGAHAMKVLAELRELAASTGGVPISFANPSIIRQLLEERRRLKREASSTPEIFSVSINGGYWFVERNPMGEIIQTTFPLMAGRMSREVALRILSELKKRGHEVVEIHANPSGGNGSSFEHLMNLPPVVEVEAVIGEAEPQ